MNWFKSLATPIYLNTPTVLEQYYFIIFFNAVIYSSLLALFFAVFFLFDFRLFRTLSEYKFFRSTGFVNSTVLVLFLSMAGVPPLLGFLSKFFIFVALFNSKYLILIILMIFFNLFVMYFYLQNVRFLVGSTTSNIFFYKNFKVFINFPLLTILVFGFFFNLSSVLFFEYMAVLSQQIIFFIRIF